MVMVGRQQTRQDITKSFGNAEELLKYCGKSSYGTKTAQRVMREYMVSPRVAEASASVQTAARSAIKLYFAAYDIVLNLPNVKRKRVDPTPNDGSFMTFEDFYKML